MEFRHKKYSVPFALPGDLVQFKILRKGRKSKFQVVHIEYAAEYPDYIVRSESPGCAHAGICGGCRSRHLDYDFQFEWKSRTIRETMEQEFQCTPALLPATNRSGFRNRMDYAVDGSRIGLRPPQDFETVLDLTECPVLRSPGPSLLAACRELLQKFPGAGWSRSENSGWLKYVTIRIGQESGVVVLTTAGEAGETDDSRKLLEALIGKMQDQWPALNLVETVTDPGQELSCTPGGRALLGEATYKDSLCGFSFAVPYDSFFQPNPDAFSNLMESILGPTLDKLSLISSVHKRKLSLLDLYCGAGVLSAVLAHRFSEWQEIRGYEFVDSAVNIARQEFARWPLDSNFYVTDLNNPPEDLSLQADLIVMDPPRAGLSPALCKKIAETATAPLILYISCNPETQIRDLRILQTQYQPVTAVLADCFPFTAHMEQAILLTRKDFAI